MVIVVTMVTLAALVTVVHMMTFHLTITFEQRYIRNSRFSDLVK